MRRAAASVLTAAVLTLPYAGTAAALTKKPKAVRTIVTKKYTGPEAQADRWGTVKIIVVYQTTTVRKGTKKTVTHKISDIQGSYSYHTDRSQYIMSQSLPMLRQEALTAQSANVQIVTNATYSSQAFIQSMQGAMAQIPK